MFMECLVVQIDFAIVMIDQFFQIRQTLSAGGVYFCGRFGRIATDKHFLAQLGRNLTAFVLCLNPDVIVPAVENQRECMSGFCRFNRIVNQNTQDADQIVLWNRRDQGTVLDLDRDQPALLLRFFDLTKYKSSHDRKIDLQKLRFIELLFQKC